MGRNTGRKSLAQLIQGLKRYLRSWKSHYSQWPSVMLIYSSILWKQWRISCSPLNMALPNHP
ncbi:hypothetical protein [Xenorhabdus griffiniae]|uniref:hypothetical protein n=1 Tax=Xenorhabdus griffiniae TaxID=351672 RepID=UPI003BAFAAEF